MEDKAVSDTKQPPVALDLAALRKAAEEYLADPLPWPHHEKYDQTFDCATVLSLLDRIEELEREQHEDKHKCHWVDCGPDALDHYHCPEGCRYAA